MLQALLLILSIHLLDLGSVLMGSALAPLGSGIAGGLFGLGLWRLAQVYPRGWVLGWALGLNPTFWLGVLMIVNGVWTELTQNAEGFGMVAAWAVTVFLVLGTLTLALCLVLPLELAWMPTALWGALGPTFGDLAEGVHTLLGAFAAPTLGGVGFWAFWRTLSPSRPAE